LQNQLLFVGLLAALGESVEPAIEFKSAGATFPQPFYEQAFNAYGSTRRKTVVRYQGVGSGAGTQALLKRDVDFGATDVRLSKEEQKRAGEKILQVPTCLGAVAVVVNLPDNPRIRLTADLLAGIFLGRITRWDERAILDLNPNVALQSLPITVVHRSDSSGTTFIFTEYLTKANTDWKAKVGSNREVAWPTGRPANGNAGVAGLVHKVPGAIGYVELVYAIGNEMTVVALQNRSGQFVTPTPESVTLAATVLPTDATMSLTDTPLRDGYSISAFSWILLYREQAYGGHTRERAEALVRLLWWLVHEGQKNASELRYGVLPATAVARAEAELRSAAYQGKPILIESPSSELVVPQPIR